MTASTDRLRVLFLQTATTPTLGADEWVLVQLIRALADGRADITVACHEEVDGRPTPVREQLDELGGADLVHCDLGPELSGRTGLNKVTATLRSVLALTAVARMTLLARRRGIQVVHTGDRPRDALAAVMIGRTTGAGTVVHVHQRYNQFWSRLLRWAVRRADVVVAISEFVAESLLDAGFPPERVRVIPNAIDSTPFSSSDPGTRVALRAELGIDRGCPLVLTVCRLFPEKGVADLIRAFADARRRVPGAHLVVAGNDVTGGSHLSDLVALCDELGVSDAVHFVGRRSDVPRLMAAADVFAMPSRGEPFGLVYLEAMAASLPVVALAEGGAREVIVDGTTGLLSARDDHDSLTQNLATLLTDPDLRRRLGANGVIRSADFSLDRQADATSDLHRELADASRTAAPTTVTRRRTRPFQNES